MSDWISVKDRMPEDGVWVLTCSAAGGIDVALHNKKAWLSGFDDSTFDDCKEDYRIVAWMPLPQPYKEEP
jgi:hypothetical protein